MSAYLNDELDAVMISHLRRIRYVPRWVIVPTINKQNVAEHSFHVAWLVAWLCNRFKVPVTSKRLVMALCHDSYEAITGDVPTPAKTRKPVPKSSNLNYNIDKLLLKTADSLEALLFIKEEMDMGNNSLLDVYVDIVERGTVWADALRMNIFESDRRRKVSSMPGFEQLFDELYAACKLPRHPALEK